MLAQPETMQGTTLEAEYATITQSVRRILASRYDLRTCNESEPDYPIGSGPWREVWEVGVDDFGTLILAIPMTFPDQLPRVYVPTATATHGTIPHLDNRKFLCTFGDVSVNSDDPVGIVQAVLAKAIEIVNAGKSGSNAADYADELAAYWTDQASERALEVLSLVSPENTTTKIWVAQLPKNWRGYSIIFTPTADDVKYWLQSVGYTGNFTLIESLHVHLTGMQTPPHPETNAELHARLSREDSNALRQVERYITRTKRPSWVLATVQASNGPVLISWAHPRYEATRQGARGWQQVSSEVPGFRPGHVPANIEMVVRNGTARLSKCTVNDITEARLTSRTLGLSSTGNHAINIIGGGSVGGFLAEGLVRSGQCRDLVIVDNEVLAIENTMRHYCGMSEIGLYKADAIVRKLRAHFPHLKAEGIKGDILDILRRDPGSLSGADLSIIALGNFGVERRLNRLQQQPGSGLMPPTCFVWVEPYLYAGHVLYVPGPGVGCFECTFNEDLQFSERVVLDPTAFIKRESGCQSTYVPYGGADLAMFVARTVRFIASVESDGAILLTWIGDLDHARQAGVKIAEQYHEAESFSVLVRPVPTRPNCSACGRPI
jgi:hypothetical protein